MPNTTNTATLIYHSAADVKRVLSTKLVNDAVEAALIAIGKTEPYSEGDKDKQLHNNSYVNQPQRSMTCVNNDRNQLLLTMPGFVGNYKLNNSDDELETGAGQLHNTLACKLVTSFAGNALRQPPLPNIIANILLFDTVTGKLNAIVDGTDITTWRTAAASVVATKYLYFRRFGANAEHMRHINVAIIGCGTQGEAHARAMCLNFKVNNIFLWNRTHSKAAQLAETLKGLKTSNGNTLVHVCDSAAQAVSTVDVICIATYSAEALICYENIKHQRTLHINAVGAGQIHFGEVAQDIYDHSTVYVDSLASAKHELKDLRAQIIGEVGEVILKSKYPSIESCTIFQSMGIAAEDACVAQAVHEALLREKA